jgi:superfamily I DNA and/or RNA helicase
MENQLGATAIVEEAAQPARLADETVPKEAGALLDALMQAYWIDQAVSLGAKPDAAKYGFMHHRLQWATQLVALDYGPISRIARRWRSNLLDGETGLRRDRGKQAEFMSDEVHLNAHVLKDMNLIFSKCNTAGHETLVNDFRPDIIIIDECGAALTTGMAIPIVAFQDCVKSVVLVGDHEQLAPTLMSSNRNSAAREMGKTIFDRYAIGQVNSTVRTDRQPHLHFFSMQHRSHPEIMDWASETIYGRRIVHGHSTTTPTDVSRTIDEIFQHTRGYFKRDPVQAVEAVKGQKARGDKPAVKAVKAVKADPGRDGQSYRMGVNVKSTPSTTIGSDTSPQNLGEVNFVQWFVDAILRYKPIGPGTRPIVASDILVETPYGSQREALRESLKDPKLHPECKYVEVCSLFGIQGREANIVIFSMVQNNNDDAAQIGFLKDRKNLNVASTRAKKFSLTIGNFESFLQTIANREPKMLQRNMDKFRSFIEHFQAKNDIITEDDLAKALDPASSADLVRDKSAWPSEFKMTGEAWAKLKAGKEATALDASATEEMQA